MKKILFLALAAISVSSSAFAFIPASSITTMSLPVYGLYTTADATCTTGLVATIPLSSTPQSLNFAQKPTLGQGSVPATIGCVIIVIGNSLSNGWASGNYTTTSNGGGSQTYNDSSCNSGGSNSGQSICGSGGTPQSITWPTKITTDAAAIGLPLTTGTCTGQTSQIVPLVLSTNSVCTGQGVADASVPACAGGNNNNFALPITTSDATHGTKLTAPSLSGNLKFVVNPANTLGGFTATTCGNVAAPLFSFAAN
jgi:hypothetical protein